MLDTFMTINAGGLFRFPLTSGNKEWKAEQEQKYEFNVAVPGNTDQHVRRRPLASWLCRTIARRLKYL